MYNTYICMYSYIIFYLHMMHNVGAVSVPAILIGYYHGLLLRDIDVDLLIDKMCSTGLLTAHEQAVISSGQTVYYRNWLLLEYARLLDLESLLKFCKLLQEEWPEIGLQLNMGMCVRMYMLQWHNKSVKLSVNHDCKLCKRL